MNALSVQIGLLSNHNHRSIMQLLLKPMVQLQLFILVVKSAATIKNVKNVVYVYIYILASLWDLAQKITYTLYKMSEDG